MTQDLAQDFINLRRMRLATDAFSKLRFYHAERCISITSLVVVRLRGFRERPGF